MLLQTGFQKLLLVVTARSFAQSLTEGERWLSVYRYLLAFFSDWLCIWNGLLLLVIEDFCLMCLFFLLDMILVVSIAKSCTTNTIPLVERLKGNQWTVFKYDWTVFEYAEYPDHCQNLVGSSLDHAWHAHKVSWKSVHDLSSNPADKKNRQANTDENTTSLVEVASYWNRMDWSQH